MGDPHINDGKPALVIFKFMTFIAFGIVSFIPFVTFIADNEFAPNSVLEPIIAAFVPHLFWAFSFFPGTFAGIPFFFAALLGFEFCGECGCCGEDCLIEVDSWGREEEFPKIKASTYVPTPKPIRRIQDKPKPVVVNKPKPVVVRKPEPVKPKPVIVKPPEPVV